MLTSTSDKGWKPQKQVECLLFTDEGAHSSACPPLYVRWKSKSPRIHDCYSPFKMKWRLTTQKILVCTNLEVENALVSVKYSYCLRPWLGRLGGLQITCQERLCKLGLEIMNSQQGVREKNGALGNTCLMGCFAEQCTAILSIMCFSKLGISIVLCREWQDLKLAVTNVWIAVATSKLGSQYSLLAKFWWESFWIMCKQQG